MEEGEQAEEIKSTNPGQHRRSIVKKEGKVIPVPIFVIFF
jgi:hypothetical protein